MPLTPTSIRRSAAERPGRRRLTALSWLMVCQGVLTIPGRTESFTTNLVSATYTNAGAQVVVGDTGVSNALQVLNGGWLESRQGKVGVGPGANGNTVLIDGLASRWQAVDQLDLGIEGSFNRMELRQGGRLETMMTTIGAEASSVGNALILQDTGTEWRSLGGFLLGRSGSGQRLEIRQGARLVTSGFGSVGHTSASYGNEVWITDPGSVWAHTQGWRLGDFGSDSNRLTVAAGGLMDCVEGTIGNGTGNRAWVTGPGSTWICRGTLFVGESGRANQLVITNGARVLSESVYVTGQTNEVVVTGGALWQTGSPGTQLVFGYEGRGNRLVVRTNSVVTAHDAYVLGDENEAWFEGPDVRWDVRETLFLGQEFAANNQLHFLGGAALRSDVVRLAGDRALLHASGRTTRLWTTNEVYVGDAFGAGNEVRLSDGAAWSSGAVHLGGDTSPFDPHERGQTNAIRLQNAGTWWSMGGELRVGSTGGRSRLDLEDGALVENDDAFVGYHGTSRNNEVRLSGASTLWNNRGSLYVGYQGWGNRLVVTNGALLLSDQAAVGWQRARDNVAEVGGAGTTWINQEDLTVGGSGFNNVLRLDGGAFLQSGNTFVGAHPSTASDGKSNQLWVVGNGTILSNRATLAVGQYNGFNTFVVSNAARVDAHAWILGNSGASFDNVCHLVQGSRVRLHDGLAPGPARWSVTQASVRIDDAEVDVDTLVVSGLVAHPFEFRGGLLRVRGSASIANQQPFQVGDGVQSARFEMGAGPHQFSNGLWLATASSARLEGMMTGSLTNQGTLDIGASTGRLDVQGMVSLASGSELIMDLGGNIPGANADLLRTQGALILGGTLRVRLVNGFIPVSVATLPFMQHAGVSGAFQNVGPGERVFVEGTSNSFRLDITATEVLLTDFQGPDAMPDSDGVDDAWALAFFGHTPLTQEELDSDLDQDGESAYREYVAGTHPSEAASVFRIQTPVERDEMGRVILRFPAATNRIYAVQHTLDLQIWDSVVDPQLIPLAGGLLEWVEPVPGLPRRYYRVTVALP